MRGAQRSHHAAGGADGRRFLPTFSMPELSEGQEEAATLLEEVAGALQVLLAEFGSKIDATDLHKHAVSAQRALDLASAIRAEEAPTLGRSLFQKGSHADCIAQGAALERDQGISSWMVAPLNEAAGRWGLYV